MGIIHCPVFHEPVISDKICSYCGIRMKKEFDKSTRRGHNFSDCDLCILLEEQSCY